MAARKPTGKTTILGIKLSADERALIEEAAGDYPISTWARVQLLEAARRVLAETKAAGRKGGRR